MAMVLMAFKVTLMIMAMMYSQKKNALLLIMANDCCILTSDAVLNATFCKRIQSSSKMRL